MKIPKTVKIGWRNYTVKFIDERRDEKGNLLDGEIDLTNHFIYIDETIANEEEKMIVFLHEVVHGIFHNQRHNKYGNNEELVEAISEGLFQLVRDNPNLFSGKG